MAKDVICFIASDKAREGLEKRADELDLEVSELVQLMIELSFGDGWAESK